MRGGGGGFLHRCMGVCLFYISQFGLLLLNYHASFSSKYFLLRPGFIFENKASCKM